MYKGEQYRHVRTGGVYSILHEDAASTDTGEVVVVYRSEMTGRVWVRSRQEFLDGRFEKMEES